MTEPFSYPARTKLIIAVVAAVAIGAFVLAGMSADTENADDIALSGPGAGTSDRGDGGNSATQAQRDPDGVIQLQPRDGTEALAQERIRIQLSAGWTGELTLLPSSGAAIPLPADQIDVTPLNELIFVPGDGQAIDRLPPGRNCVRATIWDQVEGREATERLEAWCFDVT
ncbi:MAG: hypothetical protein ACSLFO_00060 [Acidimicrobiales bacterium]